MIKDLLRALCNYVLGGSSPPQPGQVVKWVITPEELELWPIGGMESDVEITFRVMPPLRRIPLDEKATVAGVKGYQE